MGYTTEIAEEGCLDPSWNMCGVRTAFTKFLESAPSLSTTYASPATLQAELIKLTSGQPFRVCLQIGEYGQSYIKNSAPCLMMGAAPSATPTDVESPDSKKESRADGDRSLWSSFTQPIKVDAQSLIVFKNVWFSDRVEVVGDGPVLFNECMFGAARQRLHRGMSPMASFASVQVSTRRLCAFSECEFVHNCGAAADVGGCEVPVLMGVGCAKLNVHNSSFLGSGIASTAMMLTDNAYLEVENVSVTRCSGHSLIIGDTSGAVVSRSIFSQNSGSIWVRNEGSLEIRDSSLEAVCGGRSNLVLTEKGRCTSHGCTISATAASGLSSGRSLVVVRDKAHLSLDTCELFWVNEKILPEGRCTLPLKVPIAGHDRDQLDELGLFLVMLMECSEGTFTRCLLRVPLVGKKSGWCAAVGVLLRSVPPVNTFPLYAVQNSVVYDYEWEKGTPVEGKVSGTVDAQYVWGLVLPYASDHRHIPDLQQLRSMWTDTNHFFEGDGEPLKDAGQAVTTYEVYCRATGRSPATFHADHQENLPSFCTNSYTKEGDFSLVNHSPLENTSPPPAAVPEWCPNQLEVDGSKTTQPENFLRVAVRQVNGSSMNSSSTSLTSYGDDEQGSDDAGDATANRGSTAQARAKRKKPCSKPVPLHLPEGDEYSDTAAVVDVRQPAVLQDAQRHGNTMSSTINGAVSMPPIVTRAPEEAATKRPGLAAVNPRSGGDRQNGTQGGSPTANMRSVKKDDGRKTQKAPEVFGGGELPAEARTSNTTMKRAYNQPGNERDISVHSDGLLLTCFTPCSATPPRRASSSIGMGDLCTHKHCENARSVSDMKPWDVKTVRGAMGRGFGLGKIGTYSKVSRGGAESVWENEENFNYANGLSYASTEKDSSSVSRSRRYNTTTPQHERARKGFMGTRGGLGFHVRRAQSSYADSATARLYDEFLRKWNTTQHFSELLDELRNDQRKRERLSREAMERQAERLHSMGLQTRCERHAPLVAGSGRNYVLQKRCERKLRSGESTEKANSGEFCTPESVKRQTRANTEEKTEVSKNKRKGVADEDSGGRAVPEATTPSRQTTQEKQTHKRKKRGHTKRNRRNKKH